MVSCFREVQIKYTGRAQRPLVITTPGDAAQWFRRRIGSESREHFVALYLDARHAVIGFQTVSVGTANASLVHPREVFQPAIAVGACALIVAHNHPTGNPEPSPEDQTITERLAECGKLLGVKLLDSLVIGSDSTISIRDTAPELFAAS